MASPPLDQLFKVLGDRRHKSAPTELIKRAKEQFEVMCDYTHQSIGAYEHLYKLIQYCENPLYREAARAILDKAEDDYRRLSWEIRANQKIGQQTAATAPKVSQSETTRLPENRHGYSSSSTNDIDWGHAQTHVDPNKASPSHYTKVPSDKGKGYNNQGSYQDRIEQRDAEQRRNEGGERPDEQRVLEKLYSRKEKESSDIHARPKGILDMRRPEDIASEFSNIYDEEWPAAYECLEKHLQHPHERDIIGQLMNIVQAAYDYCRRERSKRLRALESVVVSVVEHGPDYARVDLPLQKECNGLVIEYLQRNAAVAIPQLIKGFIANALPKSLESRVPKATEEDLRKYIEKAVWVCWWMCVQDPPIYMCRCDGWDRPFEGQLYRVYLNFTGKRVDFYVWPALKLHEEGPVLFRGVAKGRQ